MLGSEEDPKDGQAVASAVFGAVFVYIVRNLFFFFTFYFSLPFLPRPHIMNSRKFVFNLQANPFFLFSLFRSFGQGFLVFCASQAWMHARQSARGDIRLS